MKPGQLLREAWHSARSQWVPTLTIAVLAATMCLTTLMTVGRTAAVQTQVRSAIEGAGSRTLQITDTSSQELVTTTVVDTVGSLTSVRSTLAKTSAFDTHTSSAGAGGPSIPTWIVYGDLHTSFELVQGRWPRQGEAIVSVHAQEVLHLDGPSGALENDVGMQSAVVGVFRAREVTDTDKGAVILSNGTTPLRTLTVTTHEARQSQATQDATLTIIAAPDATFLSVSSATDFAQLQETIAGNLVQYGAGSLALVLGTGAALTAIVVLSDVLIRRKDLGRRRALGATRQAIVTLVTLRTILAAASGTLLGSALGVVLTHRIDAAPPWTFLASTAILTMITAIIASAPPALLAAYRDPVTVLRTP